MIRNFTIPATAPLTLSLSLSLSLFLLPAVTGRLQAQENEISPTLEFFEKKVRPILVNNCYSCHSADTKPAGGLRVDDLNGLLQGGDEGPAVVRGQPEKSLLLERVNHKNEKRRMPQDSDPLTAEQIADLTTWIKDGADWPRERIPASLGRTKPEYEKLKANHWAWQPLTSPAVPAVADADWPKSDVDRFVLAKLEEKKLPPVADADPLALLRRITFDLTGLPPSPAELADFQRDHSPEAYARLVDRLLASPAFGERWGRHWLDIARFGESTGPSRNIPYPHAWRYRDYVLDAVNRDVPFDRFLQEQIAGDLLPSATPEEKDRLLTATGFLALGVKDVNQRFKTRFIMDNVDEQIDTVSKSVLGLTVSCARCHDHKFDPIPTRDYYALAGIFTSTDDCAGVKNKMGGGGLDYYVPAMLVRLSTGEAAPSAGELEKLKKETAEAKEKWDAIRGTPEGLKRAPNGQPTQRPFRLKYERLQAQLNELSNPAGRADAVHGVRDAAAIADTEVRIRGEAERLGPTVPRGFLSIFNVPGAPAVNPAQSGRLELAQWLTSPNNPLTPRVAVNRIWQHLFGEGIVTSVDNFGVTGDVPSHPELLDFLARKFLENGWSTKKLVRELVLTRSYQLGTEAPEAQHNTDPANRFVWRHSPRRLSAEEIRDAILTSSGSLQNKPPGASAAKELKMIEMRDNGQEAKLIHTKADTAEYRSVYLPLLRGVTAASLEAFDPVTQSMVTGRRDATTVPTQALYLLNSTFVRSQSLALGEKVAAGHDRFDADWLAEVYQRVLGRQPNAQEIARDVQFLAGYAVTWSEANPPAPPAVPAAPAPAPVPANAGTDEKPAAAANANNNNNTGAGIAAAAAAVAVVVNPDDIQREDERAPEAVIQPKSARAAAWAALIQALYASAEFRFVR
ncbi:MAG: PSD1 and planctomycete cytochrome C domain-containing protein [Verrucomicrobiota bacterium]